VESVHLQALVCFYFSNTQLKHRCFIDASAMSTVHPIDEEVLTEAGQDGVSTPPGPEQLPTLRSKEMTMNAKLLFAATVAVSALATFASTTVLADEIQAPLTRAQVTAQFEQARADGTLQRTDYDGYNADRAVRSTRSRADVLAELAAAKLNPAWVDHNSSFDANPFAFERPFASTVTRAQVKAETREAVAKGTIPRNDHEYEQAALAQGRSAPVGKPILARLFRSKQTGS
jgi:hypothetical protein